MTLKKRQDCYEQIETYRKRPLVVYATSTRQNVVAQMAGDAVREFIDQIDVIDSAEEGVDVLIHSTGGDGLTAWKLLSILRERFKKVAVLVPNQAFSAATLFALGADEIVMHPHASLGPIDPQITVSLPNSTPRSFSYEDVGAFLRFVSDEVKVTEQAHTSAIMEKLFSAVDPLTIGAAKRASDLATDVGERMLRTHMRDAESKGQARKISEDLNRGFFAHGDAVSRTRAKELKLRIAKPDDELEKLIWQAYLALEEHMELRKPLNPVDIYMSDPRGAQALAPVPPLTFPPNADQALIQNLWNAWAQQALQRASSAGVEVAFTVINAVVESTRLAFEHHTDATVFAWRGFNASIQMSVTNRRAAWQRIDPEESDSVEVDAPEGETA